MAMRLRPSRLCIPVRGFHYTLQFVSPPSVPVADWAGGLTVSINQFRLHETTLCQQISLSRWTPLSGDKTEKIGRSVDTVSVTKPLPRCKIWMHWLWNSGSISMFNKPYGWKKLLSIVLHCLWMWNNFYITFWPCEWSTACWKCNQSALFEGVPS